MMMFLATTNLSAREKLNDYSMHYSWHKIQCACCGVYMYYNGLFLLSKIKHSEYAALLWQKEASDKRDISCKRAKCVCHFHWRQWNIMMSYLTYLLAGWVFMHTIWPGRRVQQAKYENINNSNLDGMSLASFCQSRAVWFCPIFLLIHLNNKYQFPYLYTSFSIGNKSYAMAWYVSSWSRGETGSKPRSMTRSCDRRFSGPSPMLGSSAL